MFQSQGGRRMCVIHPDVETTQAPVKTKKGWRLGEACQACDEMVAELKRTKITNERHSK